LKIYKVEVSYKEDITDPLGNSILKDIEDLGIEGVKELRVNQIYYFKTKLDLEEIERITKELLIDPVINKYKISLFEKSKIELNQENIILIEITYNPGVMDPWEESIIRGIKDLGYGEKIEVKTAKEYLIKGNLKQEQIDKIKDKILINKVIQKEVKEGFHPFPHPPEYKFELKRINILEMKDEELMKLSKEGQLFLNLEEMRTIKEYFRKLGRNPSDCELETLAQTWSEHCKHKTLRGKIDYVEVTELAGLRVNKQQREIKFNNLLKETIMKVTEELNKPWCISVFKDNSGIIEFDDKYNICFKVETHNHPSAIEPYGGANTGIGGVIRDPVGTGLGAKPILNTDIFCFAPPDYPYNKIPPGVLHPKRIMKGVVAGVRDYGNRMGIPTVNGAICFHPDYLGNPLVYCGNVGIMPKECSFKKVAPGDLIVLIGGRTGRDGIHGATFSSAELTHASEDISSQSVQIGNPITEKKFVDALLKARDQDLYNAITDCGAGGLSSAVGEMGEETGARVDLEKVPLKYKGLSYTEIWISEAQERMVLAVPPEKINRLQEIFEKEDVEITVIGEFTPLDSKHLTGFTNNKKLRLYYQGNLVCDLDMNFLHNGLPQIVRKAVWEKKEYSEPEIEEKEDYTQDLLKLLSTYNIASKEWVIRQYDHEVQGGSIIKPLVGIFNDGPSDAGVVKPILNSKKAVAVANGINPLYGLIDPYWMSASCIDEAVRQLVAIGCNPERIALLDNFCWGDTDKQEILGSLVRSAIACYDVAKAYGTPFISGKDSLNNEFHYQDKIISIPPTLLISSIGIIDVEKCLSMDFKKEGDLIYLIGKTFNELGGSQYYYWLKKTLGNNVPKVRIEVAKKIFQAIYEAIQREYILSCHDLSEGGLATALAEICFAGGLGATIFLNEVPQENNLKDFQVLFSESNSRFLIEVNKNKKEEIEKIFNEFKIPYGLIGCLDKNNELIIYGLKGKQIIKENIYKLKSSWQSPLNF
jgi:phosphoribosylformylglycinamidine synthase